MLSIRRSHSEKVEEGEEDIRKSETEMDKSMGCLTGFYFFGDTFVGNLFFT